MKKSNAHDGTLPRKSKNESVTPHEGKTQKLKSEPKDNPNYTNYQETETIIVD